MPKLNQAVLAVSSCIALFGGAMTLITLSAKAGTTCTTIGGSTYCNGLNKSSSNNTISDTLYSDHNYGGNSWSSHCTSIGSTTYCD